MAAIRFDIYDPNGVLQVDDAMISAPDGADPRDVAADLIAAPDNAGWRIVLWSDVNLVGDRGKPDVDMVAP